MAGISLSTMARFWSKVSIPKSDSDCWEWQAGKNEKGYGRFRAPEFGERKTVKAHRVAYIMANGEPSGPVIRHTCDNPSCVNPSHLMAGTFGDNNRDTVARGRHRNMYAKKLHLIPPE